MIRMVVFDMAGTTIDEDNLVYKCLAKALQNHGISLPLEIVLDLAAGKEKKDAIRQLYQHATGEEIDENLADEIYISFSELLDDAYNIYRITLFEDVPIVLSYLKRKNIKTVFNTGYKEEVARKILDKVSIREGDEIDLLVTADQVKTGRPSPDMILYALDSLGVKPSQCVKIGDSAVDITEGKNAGIAFSFGITTGAQNRDQLSSANPDKILSRLMELIPIIEETNLSL